MDLLTRKGLHQTQTTGRKKDQNLRKILVIFQEILAKVVEGELETGDGEDSTPVPTVKEMVAKKGTLGAGAIVNRTDIVLKILELFNDGQGAHLRRVLDTSQMQIVV